MGLPAILGGVSLAAGLLGGHKSYGSGADFNTGRGYLGQEGGIGQQYGTLAGENLGNFNADNAAFRTAAGNEQRYLEADPYTDSYSTGQIARATNGSTSAFQAARSALSASLARRGLTDSSQLAGGLSGIDAQQAASTTNAQNALAQQAMAAHGQRLAALTGLTGGMAGTDYGRGVGALGAENGVYGNLAGRYLGLGQGEQSLEQQSQAAQNQLIASGAGMVAGGFAPQAAPAQLPWNPYQQQYAASQGLNALNGVLGSGAAGG